MEVFTLNDVPFHHIKVAFNHKWVSTALNERHVSSVFQQALSGKCGKADTGLVLDIGSNTGIYGLYAATLGCRVAMFDPSRSVSGLSSLRLRATISIGTASSCTPSRLLWISSPYASPISRNVSPVFRSPQISTSVTAVNFGARSGTCKSRTASTSSLRRHVG